MSTPAVPVAVPRPAPGLRERLGRLWARRETIRFLTASNLKSGQRDKVLGHLWNVLDPLMFMLVYYFVFGVLFGLRGGGRSVDFMLYILVAILTFTFIQGTIAQAANCIRGNRGLIHEINFPKAVFPISVTFSRLYDFMWGLVVLFAFLLVARVWPTIHVLWVPLLVLVTVLFTMGVAFVVAYLGAFFADTTNVVNVVLRLLFYCSPIFYFVRDVYVEEVQDGVVTSVLKYPAQFSDPTILSIYMSNPIACLFECFRDALLWGRAPDPRLLLYAAGVAVVTCFLGFVIFTRGEGKFAKYV